MRVMVIYLILLLTPQMSFGVPVARQVNVSTSIEKNNFSFGEFVVVEFIPGEFLAEFSAKLKTFKDIDAHISVVTSLLTSDANNGFWLHVSDNSLLCIDRDGNEVQLVESDESDVYGFVRFSISGIPVPVGSGVLIERFNIVEAGMWAGYYPVKINFSALSLSNLSEGKCSGNISVRVEFNI